MFLIGDTMNAETLEFLERTGAVSLGKPFLVAKVMQAIQRALAGRPPARLTTRAEHVRRRPR